MYLSRLELHGFKSFAQKTTIHFDPGVTAIVGPNGCGKSNVIDAVRWVLGEQRARLLRSDRMENVIFNGTEEKRALGLAEVALTIENTRGVLPTEYSEVTIARRLYRSGESEYLLNGATCRLKDILDLFMDTGMGAGAYSVIELKMIDDILSDDADDRRRLFEEAAGVTKYKLRRKQALNRLGSTQADLLRLADLVEEIERNVRSLERQAQKAARHQQVAGRLRTLELALAAWDFEQLGEEHRRLDHESRRVRTEAEALSAQLSTGEATLEAQRTAQIACEQELSRSQEQLNAHIDLVRKLEAEIRIAEERRTADGRALDRLAREAEIDAARAVELAAEKEGIEARLVDGARALAEAEEVEAKARKERDAAAAGAEEGREALADVRREVSELDRAAAAARAALDRWKDRRELGEQEQERISAELAALVDRARAGQQANQDAAERFRAAQDVFQAAENAYRRARDEDAAWRETVSAAEESVGRALVARDTASAEVELLNSLVAEGASALSFLAEHEDWATSAVTVADLIACREEDRLALDTALGEWAESLVVDTEKEARAGIARLRVAERGRATFIVLERLAEQPHRTRSGIPPGSSPAIRVTRVSDARYEPLLRLLLQNVFILDDLDEARRLRDEYPEATLVTRSGEWTSARGFLSGGKGRERLSASRLGRQERLKNASERHAEADRKLDAARAALASARASAAEIDVRGAEAALENARSSREEARAAVMQTAVEQRGLDELRSRLVARREAILEGWRVEPGVEELEAEEARARAEAREGRDRLSEAEKGFEAVDSRWRSAADAWSEARLALAQAQNMTERLAGEAKRTDESLAELERRDRERAHESERLREGIVAGEQTRSALTVRLDEERTETDRLQKQTTDAEQALLESRALIADTEKTLREIRQKRDETVQRQNALDMRLTEIITRQDAIVERLEEEHGIGISKAVAEIENAGDEESPFEPDAAREEIPQLRNRLRTMGAVNELALESFEEEKQRLEFLSAQHADLQEAEATLLNTIDEINTTAAERFEDTFGKVREAFELMFADLFGENATATLTIDGDDPLEAPIEIKARPKGKKPSTINQLSGGEKSLTAIALLFAIYLVKPSPFCILDEVDAPLDDSNIRRFMDLIRSFADSTQFILVTHNKLTMEAADRMYGITMPEPGVSRLVGVRFDDTVREETAVTA